MACVVQLHPFHRLQTIDNEGLACLVLYNYGVAQAMAFVAPSFKIPFDPCSLDLPSMAALVEFYHTCLGFHVKQTWIKEAIKAGNCDSFDSITYSNVARYCPDANKTIMGHLAQQR
jgi:hypothetical protein